MNQMEHPLGGLTFGLFGKGGSGKSTVSIILARALVRAGYTVALIDADSSNHGIHSALGVSAPGSLLDYFGGMVFSGGKVTCPVDDPTPLAGGAISLNDLPGGYSRRTAEGIIFLAAGKIGSAGPGAGCDGPISKIARDLVVTDLPVPAVTLLDFKAGLEDSARGVLTAVDRALVVVDPTAAAIQLAIDLESTVARIHDGQEPATSHLESLELAEIARARYRQARVERVDAIVNRITGEQQRQFIVASLKAHGVEVIGAIQREAGIEEAWLTGARLGPGIGRFAGDGIVAALEKTATGRNAGIVSDLSCSRP